MTPQTPPTAGLVTDLPTAPRAPLNEPDPDHDAAIARTVQRIAPDDGTRILLVAASFNSSI